MEDPISFLVDSDPPRQIPYSPPIREEPVCRDRDGSGIFKGKSTIYGADVKVQPPLIVLVCISHAAPLRNRSC